MNNNEYIATMTLSNFGEIVILDINDEEVVSGFDYGEGLQAKRKTKLFYNYSKDYCYFVRYGVKYRLDNFMKVDF